MQARFGIGILPALLLAGCETAAVLHPADIAILAACNVSPNYLPSLTGELRRWASFPLTVSVSIDPGVVGAANVPLFREAVMDGLEAWSDRLPSPIGDVIIGEELPDAQVLLSFRPLGDGNELGVAQYDPPRILTHADIFINMESTGLDRGIETWLEDLAQGRISTTHFRNDLAAVVAHEMGHALGIGEHSPSQGDLMYFEAQDLGIPPALLISDADVNSMLHSYCQR